MYSVLSNAIQVKGSLSKLSYLHEAREPSGGLPDCYLPGRVCTALLKWYGIEFCFSRNLLIRLAPTCISSSVCAYSLFNSWPERMSKTVWITLLMWAVKIPMYRMNIIWGHAWAQQLVWNKEQVICGSHFFPFPVRKHCTTCVIMVSDTVRLHLGSHAKQPRARLNFTHGSTAPASTSWLFSEVFASLFHVWFICYPGMFHIAFVVETVIESMLPNETGSFF